MREGDTVYWIYQKWEIPVSVTVSIIWEIQNDSPIPWIRHLIVSFDCLQTHIQNMKIWIKNGTHGHCTCVEVGVKLNFSGGQIFSFFIFIPLFLIFSPAQPFVICVFQLVYLNDLHYFSLWPLLRWINRWYCRTGWRQRGPKILNICRTESYRTKNRGRILPGFYWCNQE